MHKTGGQSCNICDQSFDQPDKLRRHMETHGKNSVSRGARGIVNDDNFANAVLKVCESDSAASHGAGRIAFAMDGTSSSLSSPGGEEAELQTMAPSAKGTPACNEVIAITATAHGTKAHAGKCHASPAPVSTPPHSDSH
ncbi:unnamed protein product [Lampetra planeri]